MDMEEKAAFGLYAKQRLFRFLCDLLMKEKHMNWSSIAEDIYVWRGVKFQRNNFYRLKNGTLKDSNIEIIVSWIEAHHDPDIRSYLMPQAIFDDMGRTARDYYFHIPRQNFVDEWDEQILQEFSGVYLCAPANDRNSLLPFSFLREWYRDYKAITDFERKGRSLDIKQYFQERSILILQRTESGFFYAAEFPLSATMPDEFETFDLRMTYEGIGVVATNAIHIQLRECLSRVPKIHTILIQPKTSTIYSYPDDLSFYVPPESHDVLKDWELLSSEQIKELKSQFRESLASDHFLFGPTQITDSPTPNLKSYISLSFSRECIYHPKPVDFLKHPEAHFIRPDLYDVDTIEKIIASPLSIGELI